MKKRPTVPPELYKSRNDAIHNLDFETAANLSKQIVEYRRQALEDFQESFISRMEAESNQYSKNYDLVCEAIALQQEQEFRKLKNEFRDFAKIYREKHRYEAKKLEEKWRSLYNQAKEDNEKHNQTAMISARILAQCENYESAMSVKNSLRQNDSKCAREVCEGFQRQYKLMTERHEQEFDHLHSLLKSNMALSKKLGKEMRIQANVDLAIEESEHNAIAINSAFEVTKDDTIRKSTISHFSPKIASNKSRRIGRPNKSNASNNNTLNASQFSDI